MRVVLCLSLAWLSLGVAFADEADVHTTETTAGPVTAQVTLAPKEPQIGDTLVLTLRVTAKAGVELLLPEFGEAMDRFPVRDFVPTSVVDAQGQTVATQIYRLDTPRSGSLRIPPLLIEFVDRRDGKQPAPPGLDAYELLTEEIPFEVKSVLVRNAATDLSPPLGQLEKQTHRGSIPWLLWLGGLVALGIAGFFGARFWQRWRVLARRQSAYTIARARLDDLLGTTLPTEHEAVDSFFVDLSGIVRRYLENRYELRAPELTTEEFLAAVSTSPDLTTEHRTLLRDFLRRADLVKFAHFEPSEAQMRESIALAERFLEETRENAPLIDVDARDVDARDVDARDVDARDVEDPDADGPDVDAPQATEAAHG